MNNITIPHGKTYPTFLSNLTISISKIAGQTAILSLRFSKRDAKVVVFLLPANYFPVFFKVVVIFSGFKPFDTRPNHNIALKLQVKKKPRMGISPYGLYNHHM